MAPSLGKIALGVGLSNTEYKKIRKRLARFGIQTNSATDFAHADLSNVGAVICDARDFSRVPSQPDFPAPIIALVDNHTIIPETSVSVSAVFPKTGKIAGIEKTIDIAVRKWYEERIFRHAFSNCIEGVCLHRKIMDENGRFHDCRYLDVNVNFSSITGLSRETAVGKTIRDLFSAKSADDVIGLYARVLESGGGTDIEYFFEPDASWYLLSVHPLFDDNFIVFVENITKNKESLRKNKQTEWTYKTIIDSGLALIWTSDLSGKCTYFNKPWLRFTGRTIDEERGDGWVDGVHPDDRESCVATYTDAFGEKREFRMEYRLRDAKGTYRWIEDFGSPRYDEDGIFQGYIGHCIDIDTRKRTEYELAEKMGELERFYRLTIDRESRMIELKREVNELLAERGLEPRYAGDAP